MDQLKTCEFARICKTRSLENQISRFSIFIAQLLQDMYTILMVLNNIILVSFIIVVWTQRFGFAFVFNKIIIKL